jgi:biopolymer transport protein TolR
MFVLVYMFMVPAVNELDRHRGVSLDMPKANYPISMRGADREDALMVATMRDDKVFFRTYQVTIEQLPARIRDGASQGAERKVYIRADARAKYGTVKEALDGAHAAGIEEIGFLVDQRRTATSIP